MSSDDVFARETLALWGFMGVGKTRIGQLLAERCGVPFVDLDAAVEESRGRTVAELFAAGGEALFREAEREVLSRLLADRTSARVIALGGGAVLDDRLRRSALDRWLLVVLTCRLETIVARTRATARPLLADARDEPERVRRLEHLLKSRREAYRDAHWQLASDEEGAARLVTQLAERWRGWR